MDALTIIGLALISAAVLIAVAYYPTWLTSRARHQEPARPVDDVQEFLGVRRALREVRRG